MRASTGRTERFGNACRRQSQRFPTVSGWTRICLLMLLLVSLLWALPVTARGQSESAAGPLTADQQPSEAGEVIYLPDAKGDWKAVPVGERKLPSLLDLLQPADDEGTDVPDYFISKLNLEGAVVNDWAELSARIDLRLIAADRWLRVPLRFDQGLLLSHEYEGDGEAAPAVGPGENGLTWMFRGQGRHSLTLSLRVPLRRTSSGSQLQLSLPQRSEFFSGELRLTLPPESFVEPSDTLHPLSGSETKDELHALLPGDRIDVRWRPLVEETTPITRSVTTSTVRLRNDVVQYTARQELRLRAGGLSHVEVRVPSGGFLRVQPVRLNDTSGTERAVVPQPTDREGWVRVPLEGVAGTLVRLDWLFEMPFDETTHQLTIDGLELAGTDEQSGTISIEGFDRHLLTRRPDAVEGVTRIGVDDLPAAGTLANLAYRIQTGNYRLVLDVDPIESTFRVTPIYVLELSRSRVRLSSRFLMSIDQGQVDALTLVWPQYDQQGWVVEPLAIGGGDIRRDEVGDGTALPQGQTPPENGLSRWLLMPTSPLTNQTQTGFNAERTLSPVDDRAEISLSFPQASGTRTLPGICIVTTADEVEAEVRAGPGTVLREQRDVPESVRQLLENLGDQARSVFTLQKESEDAATTIDVSLQVRDLQVSARSVVRVQQIETDPQVTQQIEFDVDFGRLSSARLQVPADIVERIPEEFRDEWLSCQLDGERLPADWRGNLVELTFPQRRRGTFQIALAGPYSRAALQEATSRVRVPVISLADRPFDTLRLVVPTNGTAKVGLDDDRWTPVPTAVGSEEWITSSVVDSVEIALDHTLENIPQQVTIPVAWIRSHIDAAGNIRTMSQYQLQADLSRLVVRVPVGPALPRFEWNGEALPARSIRPLTEMAGQYLIELPERLDDGWLGITFVLQSRPLGWGQATPLEFPSFGQEVKLEQTFWDLHLPLTQYLLLQPEGLSPKFEWTRSGLVWRRESVSDVPQMRSRFVAGGARGPEQTDSSNAYSFETLGVMQNVTVHTTNNALLVFVGAGLTLLVSFLVLKVPGARNLWLWLSVGTLLAVASLWYLDVILLLLQPAAWGLVLPLVAVLFDRGPDRRPLTGTLSTSPGFELTPVSSEDPGSSVGTGRDSIPSTLVRPQAISDSGVR
jgi:hypothetical protein